jgi:hypothetical protein
MHTLLRSLDTSTLAAYTSLHAAALHARHRLGDQRGEGIISVAIVVLIMAFLGAAMWVAFKLIFDDATSRTSSNVNTIGGS